MVMDGKLRGKKILLVEDNRDIAELFTLVLGKIAQAIVATTYSAKEALTTLSTYEPDIVVSDIALPGLDGYSLIEQVYAYEEARGRKIIAVAVTAYALDVDRAKALSVDFQMHIQKPVEPEKLVAVLAALADGSHKR